MKVFIVVCHDRHSGDAITVHATRAGADDRLEEFRSFFSAIDHQWTERNYGRSQGWVRYVETHDDGPRVRIQEVELMP